jgi:FHA domain
LAAERYLLVDLSNICRDESVSGKRDTAAWSAFERLVKAIRQFNIEFTKAHLIADASLVHLLDAHGRAEFRRLERSGGLEVSHLADEPLMAYAFTPGTEFFGALIASMDGFADFRRRYPQIQGSKDRFIGWRAEVGGGLTAYYRDMGTAGHNTMSRKEERGELKARRIRRQDVQQRAEDSYFACTKNSCLVHRLWPDHLRELPLYDDRQDTFRCRKCRSELKRVGARPESVQLIVFVNGVEQARILLQRGETLELGRVDAEECIGLRRLISKDEVSAISRRHVEFAWRSRYPEVRDLGSKNGTRLQGPRSGGAKSLAANQWTPFRRGEIIILPDSISIELSGRRVAFEGERPLEEAPKDDTESPTRLAP